MEGANIPEDYEPGREVWRASFLKALVAETEEGSLAQIARLATAHPTAIHEFFTTQMTIWMLEDKVYPWYDFVGCTAIFVAAAYARVDVVRWLLDHGADPMAECKFPGMDLHSPTKTLGPVDVVGQYGLQTTSPNDIALVTAMLSEKLEPKAPPMPSLSMKCVWHAWVEKIPYQASRYNVGDEVLCTWQSGFETYAATVKRLNPKEKIADEQTYRVLFEPPDGGYYKAQVKKGRDGEPDTEVLFVYNDGKLAPPLYADAVPESSITRPDGTVPLAEIRYRRVLFTQLRAKLNLDWTCFWVPPKAHCRAAKHQLRYRNVHAASSEWTNVPLDVPHAVLKGLYLSQTYEFQARARNHVGWSDFSKPVLRVDTPKKKVGPGSRLTKAMATYGYCKDLNPGNLDEAEDADWHWLEEKYGVDGPYAG